ncbi:hypothetical protein CfE428DRAFT_2642 [Chthoniobacter flavus Ellin428]|uniref:Uncharacterized protein n=1 Tax=Chthoniobacter flavus Ellin428 TaxID=497964 RepID=B4D141_9BACT|nr:hypothetical protein CfE428DRAFT_2642 [Chthoniobacter flavus Ellin428]
MTFTSFGGTTVLKWMAKPWLKRRVLPLLRVGLDVLLESSGLLGVGQRDEDDVGLLHRFTGLVDLEALFLGDRNRLRTLVEADDDLGAGFLEVQCVGVALRTEAEDGEGFAFEDGEISVFVSVDFGHER